MLNYQQMAANFLCLKATGAGEFFQWIQAVYISGADLSATLFLTSYRKHLGEYLVGIHVVIAPWLRYTQIHPATSVPF